MERRKINQSLGGIRMEDQGVKSPETFLVNNFLSFNHCKNTDDDQCAFK